MFELFKIYETAIGEKNKFLRKIYVEYIRRKLKKIFFNKFDPSKVEISYAYLIEFFQFYNCTKNYVDFTKIRRNTYSIINFDVDKRKISIYYMDYIIKITVIQESRFVIDIVPPSYSIDHSNIRIINLHFDDMMINKSVFKEIINTVIYNYCVSYIYGYKGKFIKNDNYIRLIEEYFID